MGWRDKAKPATDSWREKAKPEDERETLQDRMNRYSQGAANAILQGLSFGFADEILPEVPQQTAENIERFKQEHPVQNVAYEVAGGATQGGGLLSLSKAAVKNIPNLLRIAGVGAIEGGLYGAGTANEGSRLTGAAQGAGLGAVAAPATYGGAMAVGRAAKWAAKPFVEAATSTNRRQAERIIQKFAEADDLTLDAVESELSRLGPDARIADLGENLQALGRATAARSGRARSIAANVLKDRQKMQQTKLIEAATGGEGFDVSAYKRAFFDFANSRKTQAGPYYEQAYSMPLSTDGKLDALLKRPSAQKALKRAGGILADEGGGSGHVRIIDAVKQDLDDQIGSALRSGKNNKAKRLINLKKQILDEVDGQLGDGNAMNSPYRIARETYSSETGLRDSANLGRSMVTGRKDLDALEIAVEGMTEGERHAFRLGALRGIIDRLESASENRNMAGKMIESVRARDILRLAFPDDGSFSRFVRAAEAQSRFTDTRNMALSGSHTARIQQDLGALDAAGSVIEVAKNANSPLALGMDLLKKMGFGDVSDETLEEVAKMLFKRTKIDPTIVVSPPQRPPVLTQLQRQGAFAGGTNALIAAGQE